ncbi:hypothetical protein SLE2022_068170 [Rubroshorea leprosula]
MFRSFKNRSEKSGNRFDFKFSNFQVLQVPKGWDKLFVSIVSMDTGKTINKSGKVLVRNGNCRWTETFSESVWIPGGDASKGTEECLFKLVIAMGSSRSSILGEATINLVSYISTKVAVPLSLPLKKCNHGTILQVKIQCLTPRTKLRDEQRKETDFYLEDENPDFDDLENKSDISDGPFTKSVGSSSSNHLEGTSQPGEPCSRDTSLSAPGSRHSFESMDGSFGRENYSSQNGALSNAIGRQDSSGSSHGYYSFNEFSRSKNSSFNSKSKVSASGSHLQNQREEFNQISHAVPLSPLRNVGSSKDQSEAAEVKVEELRAEARMWEQNARKLMSDVENLQKELFDHSCLEMELSNSRSECDSLKQEVEQLKILSESLKKQTAAEDLRFQSKDLDSLQKELENELKFQREENANLALQLKKTQESNIELVSILQELEEMIETQKIEIDNLSRMKSEFEESGMDGHGCEDHEQTSANSHTLGKKAMSPCNSDQEGCTFEHPTTNLHLGAGPNNNNNENLKLQLLQLQESQKNLQNTIKSLEKTLEDKNLELEIERGLKSQSLMECEAEWKCRLSEREEMIMDLEAKLSNALDAPGLKEMSFENEDIRNLPGEIEVLRVKVQELERDCNELTDENLHLLFQLKDSRKELPSCSPSSNSPLQQSPSANHFHIQSVDLENKCDELKLQLKSFEERACYLESELAQCRARVEEQEIEITALQQQLDFYKGNETENKEAQISESLAAIELSKLLTDLDGQIQLSLANLKQDSTHYQNSHTGSSCSSGNVEICENTDVISHKTQVEVILNNFIQLKQLFEANSTFYGDELQNSKEARAPVRSADAVQNMLEGHNFEEVSSGQEERDVERELLESRSEVEKLKADNLLKEEQLEAFRLCERQLETQISSLKKEKSQMEAKMEMMLRESSISNIDSQIAVNNALANKSSDIEYSTHELEVHLSELEEENVQLSERLCGLEAQLRYLTEEKETSRLELQNSESKATSLQDEMRQLETEMEAHRVGMRQKLEAKQKCWLEAQEECEYLKVVNLKLQTSTENLTEECGLLQKANAELRKQKKQLHEHCTVLKVELKESEEVFSNMLNRVQELEEKYSTLLEEFASKEKALNLELDALLVENRKEKDKLVTESSLLNQMYLEKTVEIENLQREVSYLTEQISATQNGKGKTASEAVLEVSHLQADKAILEGALQDVQQKLQLCESNLNILQLESETEVQGLNEELAVAKQKEEILMADHEKLLELLEEVKSNEEKHKNTVRGLELKLKTSEYESLQLAEEESNLKDQLQKMALLQNEIVALKRTINEITFKNERLEASFQMLSSDYGELQAEKTSFLQKISCSQEAISELDECRHKKVALEEKVLRLQGDLTAREALGAQEAAVKNELAQIRRENSQFQRKIKCLEKEKEEYLKRVESLEEDLNQIKEVKQEHCESMKASVLPDTKPETTSTSTNGNLNLSAGVVRKQTNAGSSHVIGFDPISKIQYLENELAEALEANDMYKAQLRSFLSGGVGKTVETKDGYESNYSASLEAELRELQDRYFRMSLKCAEVEAQREQLVMKLKAANTNGRRGWFS